MLKFEDYLADFSNTIDIREFLINLIVASVLSLIVKSFYVRFGMSVSNREKFAAVFVPLSLTTLLVITVVQSSIALSLGLVGALSIVRFRAAIKEPEELTYLFLSIGIGLVTGANKPMLAIIAIILILALMLINNLFRVKSINNHKKMYLNIKTKENDLNAIVSLIDPLLDYIELKRMETTDNGLFLSFIIKSNKIEQLNDVQKAIKKQDPTATISVIDQPDLIL